MHVNLTVVVVGFNPREYNVSEGDGLISVGVERRGATAQQVSVNITTYGHPTVTGIHYQFTPQAGIQVSMYHQYYACSDNADLPTLIGRTAHARI